ncbi:hypothetical protein DO72_4862 [Burkholderia pseudomallei]|nr:hypothetical protein DO73_4601 [Burkholderia pseudomallei]KGD42527.1 hypothetical protein DO72_4862 [Burkholderia pseudomallei]KGD58149.1 hypothetical protein DP49_5342 [Burkholderia pseudomallei]
MRIVAGRPRAGRGGGRAHAQRGRQRDRVGPCEPLAQPVRQRLPGRRNVGVREAGKQADQRRAAERATLRDLHHATGVNVEKRQQFTRWRRVGRSS